jgi:hypothetical protein
LALRSHAGERSAQTDVHIPMDLIAAVKDIATRMMGMEGAAAEEDPF